MFTQVFRGFAHQTLISAGALTFLCVAERNGAPEARSQEEFYKKIKGLTRTPGDFVGCHVGFAIFFSACGSVAFWLLRRPAVENL